MKTITYKFADGTTSKVQVSDELYQECEQMNREENRSNRKETRRHLSLDNLLESGMDFPSNESGFQFDDEFEDFENEEIVEILKELSEEQKIIIKKIIFEGWKNKDLAIEMGLSEKALSKRFQRIIKFFQKSF